MGGNCPLFDCGVLLRISKKRWLIQAILKGLLKCSERWLGKAKSAENAQLRAVNGYFETDLNAA
jgi:hypothetical protein